MAATPDGGGYWLAEANGTVFNFGDALALAQLSPVRPPPPWWGSPSPPTGRGPGSPNRTAPCSLWHRDRPRFAIGRALHLTGHLDRRSIDADSRHLVLRPSRGRRPGRNARRAAYYGSAFGKHLVAPIVALVSTPDRKGYWLIGADGSGIPVRRCPNKGGAGGKVRRDPVVAAAATPDGGGYWLTTSAGHVMAFGDARNRGSIRSQISGHVISIVATPTERDTGSPRARRGLQLRRRFSSTVRREPTQRACRLSRWRRRPTTAGTGSPMPTGPCSASATQCAWRASRR